MTELTETQLARLRRKIADQGTPPAFPDDELQDIWDEAGENWNLTIVMCFNELLASAAKFNDYTQNESQEKKSQISKNLADLRDYYQKLYDQEGGGNTTRIVGIKVQRRQKCYPNDGHDYRRSNAGHLELDDYDFPAE